MTREGYARMTADFFKVKKVDEKKKGKSKERIAGANEQIRWKKVVC